MTSQQETNDLMEEIFKTIEQQLEETTPVENNVTQEYQIRMNENGELYAGMVQVGGQDGFPSNRSLFDDIINEIDQYRPSGERDNADFETHEEQSLLRTETECIGIGTSNIAESVPSCNTTRCSNISRPPQVIDCSLNFPMGGYKYKHKEPPKLRFGNKSFQPTAKFEKVPQALPAKPGTVGFAQCHEKAMAARFVVNSIHYENSDDEQDLVSNSDIFSRFWIETNVIDKQKEIESENFTINYNNNNAQEEEFSISSFRQQSDSIITNPSDSVRGDGDTSENAEYNLWNETSILDNLWNYDLWNNAPMESTVPHTSTIGVGTDDNILSESNVNRISAEGSRSWPRVINRRLGGSRRFRPNTHNFDYSDELFEESFSSMFRMDIPTVPSNFGEELPPSQIPRSFLDDAYIRAAEHGSNDFSSDSETSDTKNDDGDGDDSEGESVFFKGIPQVDATPHSLFDGINLETNEGAENNTVVEPQTDDTFFIFETEGKFGMTSIEDDKELVSDPESLGNEDA